MTIVVKPSKNPPVPRYVIQNSDGFYYTGHGQAPSMDGQGTVYEAIGESGVPTFDTRNELFAIKYGDLESIERLKKDFKIWCINNDRSELLDLLDKCDVVESYR